MKALLRFGGMGIITDHVTETSPTTTVEAMKHDYEAMDLGIV